jgi:hypothetical protein
MYTEQDTITATNQIRESFILITVNVSNIYIEVRYLIKNSTTK